MDYSCLDNIATKKLTNTYSRISLNYAQVTEHMYTLYNDRLITTAHIGKLVKRHNEKAIKINGFKTILKYWNAVPYLVRLIQAEGVWSAFMEDAYSSLAKCRIEEVNPVFYSHKKILINFISFLIGDSVHFEVLCWTGRNN